MIRFYADIPCESLSVTCAANSNVQIYITGKKPTCNLNPRLFPSQNVACYKPGMGLLWTWDEAKHTSMNVYIHSGIHV